MRDGQKRKSSGKRLRGVAERQERRQEARRREVTEGQGRGGFKEGEAGGWSGLSLKRT